MPRYLILTLLMLVALLATWQVRDHAFFWDTVQLASRHAHWYYGQHFQHLLLPDEIDSGHPPGFGMYLAAVWVLFGKSLAASHLAMLPFLFGIIYLLYIIGSYFGGQRSSWMLILLAFAGPVLAGQSVLVSPDIVLVFAFLLALSGILYQKEAAAMAGALLLAACSGGDEETATDTSTMTNPSGFTTPGTSSASGGGSRVSIT